MSGLLLRDRLPSFRDVLLVFAVCTFPIHIWALLSLFQKIPVYLLRLSTSELIGIVAYTLSYALLESLLLVIFLILLSMALPERSFRSRFVTQGTVLIAVISLWLIPVHYQGSILLALEANLMQYMALIFIWTVSFVTLVALLSSMLRRHRWFERSISHFVDRVTVLAVLYVFLDLLSVGILLVRNIAPGLM